MLKSKTESIPLLIAATISMIEYEINYLKFIPRKKTLTLIQLIIKHSHLSGSKMFLKMLEYEVCISLNAF